MYWDILHIKCKFNMYNHGLSCLREPHERQCDRPQQHASHVPLALLLIREDPVQGELGVLTDINEI